MTHIVYFTPEALNQLDELEHHIAKAITPLVAGRYVDAIVDHCEKLRTFPHRGAQRDDIRPDLRTLGFRRRVTVAFEVATDTVIFSASFTADRTMKRFCGTTKIR